MTGIRRYTGVVEGYWTGCYSLSHKALDSSENAICLIWHKTLKRRVPPVLRFRLTSMHAILPLCAFYGSNKSLIEPIV